MALRHFGPTLKPGFAIIAGGWRGRKMCYGHPDRALGYTAPIPQAPQAAF